MEKARDRKKTNPSQVSEKPHICTLWNHSHNLHIMWNPFSKSHTFLPYSIKFLSHGIMVTYHLFSYTNYLPQHTVFLSLSSLPSHLQQFNNLHQYCFHDRQATHRISSYNLQTFSKDMVQRFCHCNHSLMILKQLTENLFSFPYFSVKQILPRYQPTSVVIWVRGHLCLVSWLSYISWNVLVHTTKFCLCQTLYEKKKKKWHLCFTCRTNIRTAFWVPFALHKNTSCFFFSEDRFL